MELDTFLCFQKCDRNHKILFCSALELDVQDSLHFSALISDISIASIAFNTRCGQKELYRHLKVINEQARGESAEEKPTETTRKINLETQN